MSYSSNELMHGRKSEGGGQYVDRGIVHLITPTPSYDDTKHVFSPKCSPVFNNFKVINLRALLRALFINIS